VRRSQKNDVVTRPFPWSRGNGRGVGWTCVGAAKSRGLSQVTQDAGHGTWEPTAAADRFSACLLNYVVCGVYFCPRNTKYEIPCHAIPYHLKKQRVRGTTEYWVLLDR